MELPPNQKQMKEREETKGAASHPFMSPCVLAALLRAGWSRGRRWSQVYRGGFSRTEPQPPARTTDQLEQR